MEGGGSHVGVGRDPSGDFQVQAVVFRQTLLSLFYVGERVTLIHSQLHRTVLQNPLTIKLQTPQSEFCSFS